jgi:hypothetical protein
MTMATDPADRLSRQEVLAVPRPPRSCRSGATSSARPSPAANWTRSASAATSASQTSPAGPARLHRPADSQQPGTAAATCNASASRPTLRQPASAQAAASAGTGAGAAPRPRRHPPLRVLGRRSRPSTTGWPSAAAGTATRAGWPLDTTWPCTAACTAPWPRRSPGGCSPTTRQPRHRSPAPRWRRWHPSRSRSPGRRRTYNQPWLGPWTVLAAATGPATASSAAWNGPTWTWTPARSGSARGAYHHRPHRPLRRRRWRRRRWGRVAAARSWRSVRSSPRPATPCSTYFLPAFVGP